MAISRAFAFFILSVAATLASPVPAVTSYATAAKKTAVARVPLPAGLRALSLHDRIAQMFVVRGYGDWPPSNNAELKRFLGWIERDRVGGFIVAGRIRNGNVISAQPFEMAAFINHVQRLAKTPLLVASDFERGASARVAESARFPYMMAYGAAHDLSATKQLGAVTAREARALGVNWVFAPDADVNNNPENPIINVRSFGEDPKEVANHVGAFIDGAHSSALTYVLVSAKHFPGHGDTAEDSHMQLAKLDQPKERIESLELMPFRAAIAHGADSIMTAHLSVPAFEPAAIPATVSRNVLTGLLREELGFKGLIVTDALEMQGIASLFPQGEAAIRAVEAGADVLLMPTDPETCIRALMLAVKSGRVSSDRINRSAVKIFSAKQRVGLFRSRLVSLDQISRTLGDEQADTLAQQVADRAVTLLRVEPHLFPMTNTQGSCLVVMSEGQFSSRGETLAIELRRTAHDLKTYVTNPTMSMPVLKAIVTDMSQCKQIYVAAFITVAANRGSVGLEGELGGFLTTLIRGPVPVALISLGNPYLLRSFPDVRSYATTFSTSLSSEIASARAILGQIPIQGKMPVTIPGLAKLGDGLFVPAQTATASN